MNVKTHEDNYTVYTQ